MRVLLLTRCDGLQARNRWLAGLGESLVSRGATVAAITRPGETRELFTHAMGDALVPPISVQSSLNEFRAVRRSLRDFRPELIVTDNERDLLMAALAAPSRTAVVRRMRLAEDGRWGWRSRIASWRARVSLLVPNNIGDLPSFGRRVQVIKAPLALPIPVRLGERRNVKGSPVIACVASRDIAAVASCLRAVARLRTRRADLSLLLIGETPQLQSMRLHAAAVGLNENVHIAPTAELFEGRGPAVSAVWVAAHGDAGALSAIAAMAHGIPVIVDRKNDVAALVAHQITGFVVDEHELPSAVALLAQMLTDETQQHAMGDASMARVLRLHGWNTVVDRVLEAAERPREKATPSSRRVATGAGA